VFKLRMVVLSLVLGFLGNVYAFQIRMPGEVTIPKQPPTVFEKPDAPDAKDIIGGSLGGGAETLTNSNINGFKPKLEKGVCCSDDGSLSSTSSVVVPIGGGGIGMSDAYMVKIFYGPNPRAFPYEKPNRYWPPYYTGTSDPLNTFNGASKRYEYIRPYLTLNFYWAAEKNKLFWVESFTAGPSRNNAYIIYNSPHNYFSGFKKFNDGYYRAVTATQLGLIVVESNHEEGDTYSLLLSGRPVYEAGETQRVKPALLTFKLPATRINNTRIFGYDLYDLGFAHQGGIGARYKHGTFRNYYCSPSDVCNFGLGNHWLPLYAPALVPDGLPQTIKELKVPPSAKGITVKFLINGHKWEHTFTEADKNKNLSFVPGGHYAGQLLLQYGANFSY
jgi:hypothetical protein